MAKGRLLIVEDDRVVSFSLKMFFESMDFRADIAVSGTEAWELIKTGKYDLILSDINLPGMSGKDILKRIKQEGIDCEMILFTGYGGVRDAVECIKKGAYEYLLKPIENETLLITVKRALERKVLRHENKGLKKPPVDEAVSQQIAFRSEKMEVLMQKAKIAAETEATILITGESGTGKTLLAKYIHSNSKKAKQPFVEVSCGALSEGLLESELFGHRKGAFTGADTDKKGKFEVAKEGTIFLDDINSASLGLQIKLLRVIEEKAFERVGDTNTIHTSARVIAATNKDLREQSRKELFREDLFHRLNVINFEIPSLNERREDLPILVQHFLHKFSCKHKRSGISIDQLALSVLCNHYWQGNVRELENMIERTIIFSQGCEINISDLPEDIIGKRKRLEIEPSDLNLNDTMERFEEYHIIKTLSINNGNRDKTAIDLGISRATLFNKLKKYKLTSKKMVGDSSIAI